MSAVIVKQERGMIWIHTENEDSTALLIKLSAGLMHENSYFFSSHLREVALQAFTVTLFLECI